MSTVTQERKETAGIATYDEVLAYVNDIRERLDLEPITGLFAGERGRAKACPIANSIRHGARDRFDVSTYNLTIVRDLLFNVYVIGNEKTPPRIIAWMDKYDETGMMP